MNLILLDAEDFVSEHVAELHGARLAHVREIHGASVGDTLRVGRLGGQLGEARVTQIDADVLRLDVELNQSAPEPLQVTLVAALPRPPSLRKVLQQATAMGVKRFVFMGARRVEKSYWQSHALEPDEIRRQLWLGLEQARDTLLPEVTFRRRFRPFVEDELARATAGGDRVLAAHPGAASACPRALSDPITLVVGPEGGFVPFEVELLSASGAELVGLGDRILRVETAVVALLARLAP